MILDRIYGRQLESVIKEYVRMAKIELSERWKKLARGFVRVVNCTRWSVPY